MFQLRINDIHEGRNHLAVDLRDVLRALGPEALAWTWRISDVDGEELWATGSGGVELEASEASGAEVLGSRLAEIAGRTHQVIWGEFRAFRDDRRDDPWIRIVVFDSSWYEVWCADETTLVRVRSAFKSTSLMKPPR